MPAESIGSGAAADEARPTALELAAAIREGQIGPVESVTAALDRAERLGPLVGAFVTLTPDLALDSARAVERALRTRDRRTSGGTKAPAPRGAPFLGVPVAIKDLSRVAGVPMRMGSAALDPVVPEVDDGAVTLLQGAGVAVVGTTSTPEFGLPCYTEPDIGPPARTPWDLTRSAGGSSGGSAAAVAAGIVPLALGSDGGGSIRIPASACGLVGLKASRGRISWGPQGVDRAGLATLGVLTRDVRDTAAALDVLARPWPGDLALLPGPRSTFLEACGRDPGRLRIGLLTDPVIDDAAPVHPACRAAAERVAEVLEDLGHAVDVAPAPFPAERWGVFRALWSVGALGVPVPPEREERLVPLTRWLREAGRAVTGLAYAEALAAAQALARETARSWTGFDVVVTPTLAQPPVPVGSLRNDADPAADFAAQTAFTPWTSVYNLTGAPAISLPLGWAGIPGADSGAADAHAAGPGDGSGAPGSGHGDRLLPIGVMLGARLGEEETLLALAADLEAAMPWRHRRPPLA